MIPAVPGNSSSSFPHLPLASFNVPNINTVDLNSSFFHYSPPSTTPISSSSANPLGFDFQHVSTTQENSGFEFDLHSPSPAPNIPLLSGQNSIQGEHVIYYFEHVRKVEYIFAGNAVTNVTYSLIVQEPRGAVTNAVCALASLHYTRMRVAQGLEAPDSNPEPSTAKYFHDEAYFQLANSKQLRGYYDESDAMAALHLVSFSLLSGGVTDWQLVLGIACDWLAQTGLVNDENPKLTLCNMSAAGQLVVKVTVVSTIKSIWSSR
jgi:hypothetical protein